MFTRIITFWDLIVHIFKLRKLILQGRDFYYSQLYKIGLEKYETNRKENTSNLIKKYSAIKSNKYSFVSYQYLHTNYYRELALVCNNTIINEPNYFYLDNSREVDMQDYNRNKKIVDALKLELRNDPIYYIDHINEGNLYFSITEFFNYRFTNGVLPEELYIETGRSSKKTLPLNKINKLKNRKKYMPDIDSIFDFENRLCTGGVQVLFCFKIEDSYNILIRKRSNLVSDEQGRYTVIPRAFHQPLFKKAEEHQPKNTIFREIYEEIFDGPETNELNLAKAPFFINKAIQSVSDTATIDFLGMTWDLELGNYHLSYLVFVNNSSWYSSYGNYMKLNWEYKPNDSIDGLEYPIIDIQNQSRVLSLLEDKKWSHQSLFTFIEGIRVLRDKYNILDKNYCLPNKILRPI